MAALLVVGVAFVSTGSYLLQTSEQVGDEVSKLASPFTVLDVRDHCSLRLAILGRTGLLNHAS